MMFIVSVDVVKSIAPTNRTTGREMANYFSRHQAQETFKAHFFVYEGKSRESDFLIVLSLFNSSPRSGLRFACDGRAFLCMVAREIRLHIWNADHPVDARAMSDA